MKPKKNFFCSSCKGKGQLDISDCCGASPQPLWEKYGVDSSNIKICSKCGNRCGCGVKCEDCNGSGIKRDDNFIPVESSAISHYRISHKLAELTVIYKSGTAYTYTPFSYKDGKNFQRVKSKGKWLAKFIVENKPFVEKVDVD